MTATSGTGGTPGPVRLRVPGSRVAEVPLDADRTGRYRLPKGYRVTSAVQHTAGRRPQRRVRESLSLRAEGADPYGTSSVARRLVDVLGSTTVADLLGVAKDRPGRWVRGEGADPANRAALADLDSLVGRLLATFTPAQAELWLVGDNAHLGARPLDVFRLRGSGPVVEAIAAREQGSFG